MAGLEPDGGAAAQATGLIVAGGALAGLISASAAGRLVPRFTHAQVLLVSLLMAGLGCGLMALSQNAVQLGFLRVVVGLFAGSILTLAFGLAGTLLPSTYRASAFGLLNSGAIVGSAASPIIAGLFGSVSLRGAFVLNTAVLVVAAIVVALEGIAPPVSSGPDPHSARRQA